MKKFILIFFLLFATTGFSQSKYFIYFVDKGMASSETLEKNSSIYTSALSLLSEKSIQRRIKNMGEDSIITYDDLPLNSIYVFKIEELGIKIENKLRWLNAVTAYLTEEEIIKLSNLSFVDRIEPVRKFVFKSPEFETPSQLFIKNNICFICIRLWTLIWSASTFGYSCSSFKRNNRGRSTAWSFGYRI